MSGPAVRATIGLVLAAQLAAVLPARAQGGQAEPDATPCEPDDAFVLEDPNAVPPDQLRLPRVVVTARKWEETTADVPQSVTVVGEETIRDGGLRSLQDASAFVPNLRLTEFSSRRLSFPFIRGIGSGQGDPAVTTYVDGVPQLTVSSTNLPLLDIERIEFLRGPQGTLYGRNALGGVIHVISKRPSETPRITAEASYGNFDAQDYRLSFSGPLVEDELFLALSGLFTRREGYTTNDFTGNDVDDRESFFGRGQILWTPDESSTVRFTVHGEHARDGGFVLFDLDALRRRPHHIAQDFEGATERDIVSYALTWDRLGETVDFTSISAFQDWDILETADFDFTVTDGVRRRTEEDQQAFSQEIRLSSSADRPVEVGGRATLKWLAGVLAFTADTSRSAANEFRPGGAGILFPPMNVGTDRGRGEFDDWGVGLFGQATLTVDERLDLTAGLRYDFESKEADLDRTFETGGFTVLSESSRLDREDDELMPRFSVAYRWQDTLMTYASAARGFKAGGFNLTAPPGFRDFAPETSWTYEAGLKSSWFDDRLSLAASAFYIDWDDMQLTQFDAASGGFVTNAGSSTSAGVEIEIAARPVPDLDVFGSFGYTDTEFDEFVDAFGVDVSGNDLAFAPRTTWNVGAQYGGDLGRGLEWFVRGEYAAVGSFYYDAGNLEKERYALAHFRAGFGGANWRIEGWIRNAFDEEYVPVAFQPSPVDPTVFVGESGAPRTYGVTCRLTF